MAHDPAYSVELAGYDDNHKMTVGAAMLVTGMFMALIDDFQEFRIKGFGEFAFDCALYRHSLRSLYF
jgi:hypothetical protein